MERRERRSPLRVWKDLSIMTKTSLVFMTVVGSMWFLIVTMRLQMISFQKMSSNTQSGYLEISDFMTDFSEENVILGQYIRPSRSSEVFKKYHDAIGKTNSALKKLFDQVNDESLRNKALMRGVSQSMQTFRIMQDAMFTAESDSVRIKIYQSLGRQSVYIDGYAKELLQNRMSDGSNIWQTVNQKNLRFNRIVIVMMLMTTLLIIMGITIFYVTFIIPLRYLGRAADEVASGQFRPEPLIVRGNDEIGRTAQSFNLMVKEIRNRIRTIEEEAEEKKALLEMRMEKQRMMAALQESRFNQLQSQVNPHFLFNALNVIASVADEESASITEDLIIRLAKFFRYSLEHDTKYVTLKQELEFLRDYVEIQKIRFGSRILIMIDEVDADCMELMVPQFILQPLVENSIIHGMKNKEESGKIWVTAYRLEKESTISICIRDNGCGFDPGSIEMKSSHHSVGISNIRKRIAYIGGSMHIKSRTGRETIVTLTLPDKIKEEGYNEDNPDY